MRTWAAAVRRPSLPARERCTRTRRVVCSAGLRTHGAEYDGGHRKVQIGVFIHDQRIVAAQLQQALTQALGDAHADLPADMCGSGE